MSGASGGTRDDFPALDHELFNVPTPERLTVPAPSRHRPRFLMLYGSLRQRSFSRLLTFEAARLLEAMGGEVRIFDPAGLPLPDAAPENHPKVQELRDLAAWCEGMVWTSPERHGAMTGIESAECERNSPQTRTSAHFQRTVCPPSAHASPRVAPVGRGVEPVAGR